MGFEPFILPKKTPTATLTGQSYDDKVRTLAELLHSRGLTSSLADARRLAEGMVTVEKKILNQTPQTSTGLAKDAAAPINNIHNISNDISSKGPAEQYKANWDERFEKFVARTAPIKEEHHRSPVPEITPDVAKTNPTVSERVIPETTTDYARTSDNSTPVQTSYQVSHQTSQQQSTGSTNLQNMSTMTKSIVYGRENSREISNVPHATRSTQIFFEDAPPLTQARGYNGPKPQDIEYVSQKLDSFKKQQELRQQDSTKEEQRQQNKEALPEEVSHSQEVVVEKIEIEQIPQMTIIDKTTISNSQKTEEEIIIVKEEDEEFLEIAPEPKEEPVIVLPIEEKPIAQIQQPIPENTASQHTAPQEKKPSQELPKVDIFEFFKVKK